MYPTAPEGSALAALFESLEEIGIEYAGSIADGGKFACPNPDHDDEHPSFDVHVGRNGKPLMTCTPCREAMGQDEFIAVLRHEGVRWAGAPLDAGDVVDWGRAAQVWSPLGKDGKPSKGAVSLTAVHDYRNADGTPNFKIKRFDPVIPEDGSKPTGRKFFQPARWEGGDFVSGRGALDDVRRTPYHLEDFADWAETGVPVYLVEGEKAADALNKRGKAATTFHGGTAGKMEDDWTDWFLGFAEVRIWPDADEAGVNWARRRATELLEAGVSVSFWFEAMPQPTDDAFDCLARGGKPAAFGSLEAAAGALDALAALKPKPTAAERSSRRTQALEAQGLSVVVNGKTLVSASAASGVGEVAVPGQPPPPDETGLEKPYKVTLGVEPYRFAEEMVDRHFRDSEGVLTLRFNHDERTFWLWDDRRALYRMLTEDEMRAVVRKRLVGARETAADGSRPIALKPRSISELTEALRTTTLTSEHGAGALLPGVGGVPFRNGWLDVSTGLLGVVGPSRDVRWSVPVDYDAEAGAPSWIKFLRSLGWDRKTAEYRLLRQWFGYLLSGSKDQERALLMLGPTRAGKGVILRVAGALLGDGAVATSLDSLTSNFGLQAFIGKGLATIPDARFGRSDKGLNARLLSLTSNDALPVDVKYGAPLSLNLGVRLMIATNETPNFIEASDALSRRFEVLKFERSFAANPDTELYSRLSGELAGIARWSLGGLTDLRESGRFVLTEAGTALQETMIMESAFVRLFVSEECTLDAAGRVSNEALYLDFVRWAEKNGMPVYNSVRFSRELLDAFPGSISNGTFREGGRSVRGKYGLRFKRSGE